MTMSFFDAQVVIPTLLCILGLFIFSLEDAHPHLLSLSILEKSKRRLINLPDRTRVRERLEKIGKGGQYGEFRIRQFTIASCGTLLGSLLFLSVSISPVVTSLLLIFSFVCICLIVDRHLSSEVTRYRLSVESEFAALIEMLTLSLSAGETPLAAMSRISQHSKSTLAHEFNTVVDSVRGGSPFHVALDALGRRIDSVVIRRFVDALITAMLRGAPLVDVLQRHATEARQNQRNILMDRAGKAEISMMVPVVFLILPVSVLFALWPSLTHLNFFAS